MEQIGYDDNTTVLERIFPWTQSGITIRVSNKIRHTEVRKDQTKDKDIIPTIPQTVSEKPDKLQSDKEKSIVNNKQQYTLPDNQKDASVFEMWNVIESVGIKRNMLNKTFASKEAVTELYRVIENRIHYEREQEMIKRLREHVTKLNEYNTTKKDVIKQITV